MFVKVRSSASSVRTGPARRRCSTLISGFVATVRRNDPARRHRRHRRSARTRARALGLGRSFQDARLVPVDDRSTGDRDGPRPSCRRVRDPIAAFLMSPAVRVVRESRPAQEVDRLIELLHLEAFADKFVGELSTGTRRIVDIACSLAHDPQRAAPRRAVVGSRATRDRSAGSRSDRSSRPDRGRAHRHRTRHAADRRRFRRARRSRARPSRRHADGRGMSSTIRR